MVSDAVTMTTTPALALVWMFIAEFLSGKGEMFLTSAITEQTSDGQNIVINRIRTRRYNYNNNNNRIYSAIQS